MDRRHLLQTALSVPLCQVIPNVTVAASHGEASIGELGSEFVIRVYGRNDSPLRRMVSYEKILQANYDQSLYVMSDPLNHPQNSDHWRARAEKSRGIDIDVSTDNTGIGLAVVGDGFRRVLIDEGYMHCAFAFAFCEAHVLTKGVSKEEFLYYFNNFYDSLKFSDPIPYFRGIGLFYKFLVEQDFQDPRLGEQFFDEFSKCLTSITTYVLYHEIGHHVLGHFSRTNAADSDFREMELEADRYAIDTCSNGLNLYSEVGFFFFCIFQYMRRSILVNRGVNVRSTHPDPIVRFDENISQFLDLGGHPDVARSFSSSFQGLIEFLDSVGPNSVPFDEQRFGVFSVDTDLPPEFRRFLRRSCNLEYFSSAEMVFSGSQGEYAIAVNPDPASLAPIGECNVAFIP